MRSIVLFLYLSRFCLAANLLTQAGTSIPANNWVKATGTTGYTPLFVGFDKIHYVPALGRTCIWTVPGNSISASVTIGTENDDALNCFSYEENNFTSLYLGPLFHDEHMCAGHTEGQWNVDPSTSQYYGLPCTSGAQGGSDVAWISSYWFDPITGIGKNKLSTPGPSELLKLGNGYVDPLKHEMVMWGGTGSEGLNIYSLITGTWTLGSATTGTCPPAGVAQASSFYRVADGKGYYFAGYSSGATNGLYSILASAPGGTSTCAQITVNGTPPPIRDSASIAYSINDDAALLFGGYDSFLSQNTKYDTWLLDFTGSVSARLGLSCTAPCWNQLSPATAPSSNASGGGTFFRLAWIPTHDVFALYNETAAGVREVWFYRWNAGDNLGSNAITPSTGYPPSPGGLNRNISASPPTPTQGTALASDGTNYFHAHVEAGGTSDASNSVYPQMYAFQSTSTQLPNPSAFNSISSVSLGSEAFDPSLAVVGSTLWGAYSEAAPGSFDPTVVAKSYNGSSWSGGAIGWGSECAGAHSSCQQMVPSLANAGGVPTIGYIQSTLYNVVTNQNLAFVKQFSGGSWSLLGSAPLNVGYAGTSSHSGADSISVAGDGTANPWVAWSEHTLTSTSPSVSTVASVYVSRWSGAAWVMQCSGNPANVQPSTGWVGPVSLVIRGGLAYVGFPERPSVAGVADGPAHGYVRACSGPSGTWSTIGGGTLNRDLLNGYTHRVSLALDGSNNLYAGFNETANANVSNQSVSYGSQETCSSTLLPANFCNFGQRSYMQVDEWTGSGNWQYMGGVLNADPNGGSVTRPAIIVANGSPVAVWGETVTGSMRQMYARTWTGTDWSSFGCTISPQVINPYTAGQTSGLAIFNASGCASSSFTITSGTLSGSGLSLNASTGVISGTAVAGSFSFTVAYDTASNPLTLTINSAPTVSTCGGSSSTCPAGTQGSSYGSQSIVTASGTSPVTCSGSGQPSGMSVNSNCTLTGTPSASGGFTLAITGTDVNSIPSSPKNFSLTINPSGGGGSNGKITMGGKVISGGKVK